ncbi:MAG: carotenoid 1,2-hydratase, partial [Pseudomonadota bacterium]
LRRWRDAPGSRRPHGRLVRAAGSEHGERGPRFDAQVEPGGYSWWYVDAISADGQHGLTIIAFLGSVFSPYYKRSGRSDPIDHACLNVALYGPNRRWVMTERPRGSVTRDAKNLAIGPSAVEWTGDSLEITIEERDTRLFVPYGRPVRGKVRVIPEALNPASFTLDPAKRHIWHCMAPRARIEVEMEQPGLSWSGKGYFDHNRGSEPLEDGFRVWHWSRAHMKHGAVVCYEGERQDGSLFASAIRFDADGIPEEVDLPAIAPLPRSSWRIERRTRSEIGVAQVRRTWEDTPFYARSELASKLYGEEVVAVQESLDMRRFASPLVQFMLPYRMPRARK